MGIDIRPTTPASAPQQVKGEQLINKKNPEVSEDKNSKHINSSSCSIDTGDKTDFKKCGPVKPIHGPINLIDGDKIEAIIGKMKSSFKSDLDTIRNTKGANRDNALLSFQGKLDNMTSKELKSARDILVKEMANPKNKDDELLGSLLNKVNQELDSRGSSKFDFGIAKPLNKLELKDKLNHKSKSLDDDSIKSKIGKALDKLDKEPKSLDDTMKKGKILDDSNIKSKLGDKLNKAKGEYKDFIEPITKDTKIGKPNVEPAKMNKIYDLGLEEDSFSKSTPQIEK